MENKFKRFLSLLLALVMVIGIMPVGHAHAAAFETTPVRNDVAGELTSGTYVLVSANKLYRDGGTIRAVSTTVGDAGKLLTGTVALGDVDDIYVWTLDIVSGDNVNGYTAKIKAANGQCMALVDSKVTLAADTTVTIVPGNSVHSGDFGDNFVYTWGINFGSTYLNNQEPVGTYDFDCGSHWVFYKLDPYNKANWAKISVDSETIHDATEGNFEYAWDGNTSTKWHSNWSTSSGAPLGQLTAHGESNAFDTIGGAIDFGVEVYINRFSFLPRQDDTGHSNGDGVVTIGSLYKGTLNADGTYSWAPLAEHVEFPHNQQWKTFCFEAQNVQYVKFVAEKSVNAGWVVVSEFDIGYEEAHAYTTSTTNATCNQDGSTVYTCGTDDCSANCVCHHTYTEVIPAAHTWVDADCDTPKTCETCGTTEGEANGHSWANATCTTPKTCETCGTTEGEANGHSWANATCTTPKTCETCGATEGEANAHTPGADATCGVPQTCTACGVELTPATGEHVYDNACDAECNVCSATREVADHVYDNACDTTCNVCNAVREVADHVYDNACDAECNVCSATREVGDHSYESKVTPPTFETAGYTTYTCSVCGHTYTADEVPAKVAVAAIDGYKYESFEAALAAADEGDTITLLNEKGITITADTTYDLSGVTVESEGDVFVVTGGTLTLEGNGTVKGGTSGVGSWTAVWANGGNVVINGGTYSVGGDSDATDTTHQNDVIYTKNGGTVTINGGTFLNEGNVWTLNQNDTTGGKITVYGGSFQNWNPADNTSEGEHTSFLADGYVSELQDGFYVVTEAPEISGTLTTCYANEYNAGESRISGEINGLYATESVEIKLYSGETLISTTKLAKTEYLPSGSNGSLTVKIEMGDDSSSWDTTWVEGHPRSDYQPDKAVLYLDGQQMNTVDVNMWANDYYEGYEGQSWVWAELTGVAKVVAKVGETNYLTLADAVEAANAGDTVTLLGNATGAGVVIDKNITIDLGTYTYTINSAVGSAGTETNGFQIKSGNDVTIKNGTLAATTVTEGKAIKMLVQNYANLTLEDVTLDGTGSAEMQYVLSNNSGDVVITGKTNITAPEGAYAFDVYDYSSAGYAVPAVNVTTTGTITGKIEVSETATLAISSGTYTVALDEAWCADGFIPTENADGTYGVTPALPTATVTPVENEELTFALNFKADEVTEAQLEKYSAWYADFVLTVNKEVTFNANGGADGYLSGQYDAWSASWVNVPFENVTLKAGESLKIMEYAAELMNKAGLKLTYNDVYNSVKDFDCGVFFTPEFLAANSDLVVTLELRMYNNEDETESYAIGETYEFTAPTVVAKVGDKGYATLAEAVAAANAGDTVILLADTNGDGIKINKNITIDLNEKTYTIDGTLVGSAKTQSNGFQILKGNEVIIKNGAIVMDNEAVRGHDNLTGPNFVIQNYANLTLEDVNITGNKETTYVVSINSGNVAIDGYTSITVEKEGAVAFDVYKSSGYEAPVVNVSTTGKITGKIEVSESINSNLNISNGTYTVELEEAWCADGFMPTEVEGGYGVVKYTTYTWYDEDGTTLYSVKVAEGVDAPAADAYVGETPTKAETETHTYTFNEWIAVDGGYKATYTATPKETEPAAIEITVKAISVSYDAEVILNQKFEIPEEFLADANAYALVVKDGKDGLVTTKYTTAQLATMLDDNGRYVLPQGIASGEMTRGVTVSFVDGNGVNATIKNSTGVVGTEVTYTVIDYADLVFQKGTQAQKDIVTALVTYGGYAQAFFNVDEGNPAYNILAKYGLSVPSLDAVTTDVVTNVVDKGDTSFGLQLKSIAAHLDSAIFLRAKFALNEGDISNYTFTLTYKDFGVEKTMPVSATYLEDEDRYYVDIPDIPAAYLDYDYQLEITNTATGATNTVKVSALAWVRLVLNNSTDAEQIAMAKALYLYNQEANEFFPAYS